MSTFDGVVTEFPGIRVDFFHGVVDSPPLAGFLSHIHSDHLAGLDTYKGRPVYCSAATRAMLLKLQRRASRVNFHLGYLEVEEITYKHQKRRLKALPLETPTEIELEPGNTIQVTLFDANHCPGAVMFLFEGNGKAVLYTGDVRSEPWHVNTFAKSPCIVEYASGIKTLDKVYLDTSFTEDVVFQTKAEGLRELLEKVSKYPKETKFYFSAWTYGYEDVWIALAKALGTRVHVDDYKINVYKSLQVKLDEESYMHLSPEAAALTGFTCGNGFQPGLLTRDDTVRLHSCEKGTRCSTMSKDDVVFITPIVTHLSKNSDLAEIGIGGGLDDLEQKDELILSLEDARTLCQSVSESKNLPQEAKDSIHKFLLSAASAQRPIRITLSDDAGEQVDDPLDLRRALKSLVDASVEGRGHEDAISLPNRIKFPYSRHSSFRELCHLMEVLKPKDIWPCTVDTVRWIKQGITIEGLFGEYCTGSSFHHDKYMAQLATTTITEESQQRQSQTSVEFMADERRPLENHSSQAAESSPVTKPANSSQATLSQLPSPAPKTGNQPKNLAGNSLHVIDFNLDSDDMRVPKIQSRPTSPRKRNHEKLADGEEPEKGDQDGESTTEDDTSHLLHSQESSISARKMETRRNAFNAMMGVAPSLYTWNGLLSTTNNHTHAEAELGEG